MRLTSNTRSFRLRHSWLASGRHFLKGFSNVLKHVRRSSIFLMDPDTAWVILIPRSCNLVSKTGRTLSVLTMVVFCCCCCCSMTVAAMSRISEQWRSLVSSTVCPHHCTLVHCGFKRGMQDRYFAITEDSCRKLSSMVSLGKASQLQFSMSLINRKSCNLSCSDVILGRNKSVQMDEQRIRLIQRL